jgi:phosphoribosyl 1,2-cyclic phosphodiesterase
MSLFFASLNSGSNGNCYYVGNQQEGVLIDVGISGNQTVKRMKSIGLSMQKVKAIFISHEHTDHIIGAGTVAAKFKIPIYISSKTAQRAHRSLQGEIHDIQSDCAITIGTLKVTPFSKIHDAIDPYSFIVSDGITTVGVFTDLGKVCDALIHYFKQCDAAFLEANYDEKMLENGTYPLALKNRIRGGKGHISNTEAFELFCNHKSDNLQYLVLAHLSKENNKPEIASTLFESNAMGTEIIVASRYYPSKVYELIKKGVTDTPKTRPFNKSKQLALFN